MKTEKKWRKASSRERRRESSSLAPEEITAFGGVWRRLAAFGGGESSRQMGNHCSSKAHEMGLVFIVIIKMHKQLKVIISF